MCSGSCYDYPAPQWSIHLREYRAVSPGSGRLSGMDGEFIFPGGSAKDA